MHSSEATTCSCTAFISTPRPSGTLRTPCHPPQNLTRKNGGCVMICRYHKSSRSCATQRLGSRRSWSTSHCSRVIAMHVDPHAVHPLSSRHLCHLSVHVCFPSKVFCPTHIIYWRITQGNAKVTAKLGLTLKWCKRHHLSGPGSSLRRSFLIKSNWLPTKAAKGMLLRLVLRESACALFLMHDFLIHAFFIYTHLHNIPLPLVHPLSVEIIV